MQKKKLLKRGLSLALAAAMMLTGLPTAGLSARTVSAAESSGNKGTGGIVYTAQEASKPQIDGIGFYDGKNRKTDEAEGVVVASKALADRIGEGKAASLKASGLSNAQILYFNLSGLENGVWDYFALTKTSSTLGSTTLNTEDSGANKVDGAENSLVIAAYAQTLAAGGSEAAKWGGTGEYGVWGMKLTGSECGDGLVKSWTQQDDAIEGEYVLTTYQLGDAANNPVQSAKTIVDEDDGTYSLLLDGEGTDEGTKVAAADKKTFDIIETTLKGSDTAMEVDGISTTLGTSGKKYYFINGDTLPTLPDGYYWKNSEDTKPATSVTGVGATYKAEYTATKVEVSDATADANNNVTYGTAGELTYTITTSAPGKYSIEAVTGTNTPLDSTITWSGDSITVDKEESKVYVTTTETSTDTYTATFALKTTAATPATGDAVGIMFTLAGDVEKTVTGGYQVKKAEVGDKSKFEVTDNGDGTATLTLTLRRANNASSTTIALPDKDKVIFKTSTDKASFSEITNSNEVKKSVNSTTVVETVKVTGTADKINYYQAVLADDANYADKTFSSDTAIDKKAPTIDSVKLALNGDSGLLLTVTLDDTAEEDGKVYYLLKTSTTDAPDDADAIKEDADKKEADTDGTNVKTEIAIPAADLTPGAAYYVYVTVADKAGNLAEMKKDEDGVTMPSIYSKTQIKVTLSEDAADLAYTGSNLNDNNAVDKMITLSPSDAVSADLKPIMQSNLNKGEITYKYQRIEKYDEDGELTPIAVADRDEADEQIIKAGKYAIYAKMDDVDGIALTSEALDGTITVQQKTLEETDVTVTAASALTYDGNEQSLLSAITLPTGTGALPVASLKIKVVYNVDDETQTSDADYSAYDGTATNVKGKAAGTYTIYYKVFGDENYANADLWTEGEETEIAKDTVTVSTPADGKGSTAIPWTGEAQDVVTTKGVANKYSAEVVYWVTTENITGDDIKAIPESNFSKTGTTQTDVGTYYIYYMIKDSANYNGTKPAKAAQTTTIGKAEVDDYEIEKSVTINAAEQDVTVSLANLISKYGAIANCTEANKALEAYDADDLNTVALSEDGTELTLKLTSSTAGDTFEIPLTYFETACYKFVDGSKITIKMTGDTVKDVTLEFPSDMAYTGANTVVAPTVTIGTDVINVAAEIEAGTLTITYAGTGRTTYGRSTTAPKDAGMYEATLEYTKDGVYAKTETPKAFTIAKAALTADTTDVDASNVVVTTGKYPDLANVIDGIVSGETASDAYEAKYWKGTINGAGTDYNLTGNPTDSDVGVYTVTITSKADGNYTFGTEEDEVTFTFNVVKGILTAPTFTPEGGTQLDADDAVTLTNPNATVAGSKIKYTTDAYDPDGDNTDVNWEDYADGEGITLDANGTIYAYVTADDYADSEVVSATYTVGEQLPKVKKVTAPVIADFDNGKMEAELIAALKALTVTLEMAEGVSETYEATVTEAEITSEYDAASKEAQSVTATLSLKNDEVDWDTVANTLRVTFNVKAEALQVTVNSFTPSTTSASGSFTANKAGTYWWIASTTPLTITTYEQALSAYQSANIKGTGAYTTVGSAQSISVSGLSSNTTYNLYVAFAVSETEFMPGQTTFKTGSVGGGGGSNPGSGSGSSSGSGSGSGSGSDSGSGTNTTTTTTTDPVTGATTTTTTTTDANGNKVAETVTTTSTDAATGTKTETKTTTDNTAGTKTETTTVTASNGDTTTTTVETAANGAKTVTETAVTTDAEAGTKTETESVTNADGSGEVTSTTTNTSTGASTSSTVVTDTTGAATEIVTSSTNANGKITTAEYDVTSGTNVTLDDVETTTTKITVPATVAAADGKTYKVTAVAKNAAKNNDTVKTIVIGKNVKTVGASAFANCKKLTKATVGANVTKIAKNTFKGDSKLKTITLQGAKVTSVGKNAFSGIAKNATITIKGSAKQVKKVTNLIKKSGVAKTVTIKRAK